ncbi:MAG: hypothetical protein ACRBCS_05765 [Cellvibrionaceae bacterium]
MTDTKVDGSISEKEIEEVFDKLDEILERTPRWVDSKECVEDVIQFNDAVNIFSLRYERSLQKFYGLIKRIEDNCVKSGVYLHSHNRGQHSFEAYEAALRLTKDNSLVKQKWRKWKR